MPRLHPLTLALATAALTVPLCAGAAIAKPIESGTFHDEFSETETDFCDEEGLTVTFDVVEDGTFRVGSRGKAGLPYFAAHLDITTVITNEANDKFVTTTDSLIDKDLKVTDNGDGTSTILVLATGNATIYDSSGKAIGRNPGQVRSLLVFDNNDTPTNPEDDEFLSFEIVKESTGRTDDFCEVILPELT